MFLRYCFVLLAGLAVAAPASAASWADRLFEEHAKDFGAVPRGPTLTHSFRVVNNTGSVVAIAGVRVSCGCTSAQALQTVLQPGQETAIVARMDTTRFIGAKSVTIFVTFNQPSYDEVRLLVQAFGRNDFAVSPDTLAFGQVKRGDQAAATSTIVFYGNGAAQITDVRSESNYIQAALKEVRRSGGEVAYELTAKLRGDLPVGKWYTDLWLRTNDPSMPQIRVPLTVEVESPLSVSPEAVAVGAVKSGEETERRVIVRGVKPFKITRVEGTDDLVSVRDSATEAREVHVLTVRVKSGKAGDLARTLHIRTDLGQDADLDLPVTAQVIP